MASQAVVTGIDGESTHLFTPYSDEQDDAEQYPVIMSSTDHEKMYDSDGDSIPDLVERRDDDSHEPPDSPTGRSTTTYDDDDSSCSSADSDQEEQQVDELFLTEDSKDKIFLAKGDTIDIFEPILEYVPPDETCYPDFFNGFEHRDNAPSCSCDLFFKNAARKTELSKYLPKL